MIIYRLFNNVSHRLPKVGFDGVAILGVVIFAAATLANANNETELGDAQNAKDASSLLIDQSYITEDVVRLLSLNGVVVIKNVLSTAELAAARKDSLSILAEGRMQYAGGNSKIIRQDKVCFIRGSDGSALAVDVPAQAHKPVGAGLQHCISLLRGSTQKLQDLGYSRSINHKVPTQCQLAHYTGNGNTSYVAHRDAASDNNFYQIGLLAW